MKRKSFTMWGNLRHRVIFTAFVLLLIASGQSHGKIQDWEKTCVVGECLPAAGEFRSCSAQPFDLRLVHPTRPNVRSEPIFKNRPSTISAETCGSGRYIPLCCPMKKTEEGMLVGGLAAEENEFPHQVRILVKKSNEPGREKCAGTIYNKDYILTAASCVVQNGRTVRPADVEVIVGQNLEHEKVPKNIHAVRDIKVHEGFRGAIIHGFGREHDIALLKLRGPLTFNTPNDIYPLSALRIPEKGFKAEGRPAIILGWGHTATENKPIGAMLKMNSYINTNAECLKKSSQAHIGGAHFRKVNLDTPRDEFGEPESFEMSRTRFSSKSGRRGGAGTSLFDDDFFNSNWGRSTSLAEWDATHELVNLGALKLGKLWSGGIEPKSNRGSSTSSVGLTRFPNTLLCLGGGENTKGYSRGDTGSPAICDRPDGTPVLCGISSFGRNEYKGEWPATYVNVAHYADWIRSHAGRQPEEGLTKDIIDGEPVTDFSEINFYIRIHNKKINTTCGGALINARTVVSSAACVPLDVRVDDLVVTSGEFSVDSKTTEHEVDGVATRETYKSYLSRSGNRRVTSRESAEGNDELRGDFPQLNLAVLKLYRPVRTVKPINLIRPHMERMIVYEYGWRTDGRDKVINRWAYREVLLDECRARYGAVGIEIDNAHLCATENYSGGERCNKELGNPLVCVDRQMKTYLCGVTSFRDCSFAFPTVFTNIRQNLDWIQL